MRKHLFGLGIFFTVVATAVVIYGFFNMPPIPVIPTVEDRPAAMPANADRNFSI